MIKAKVVGAGGYGGCGIVELLLSYPEVEIQTPVAATEPGMPMSDLYPHQKGFDSHAGARHYASSRSNRAI
jgi:N-acetyl-gamma-glutamyl-phosphate reductase